MARYKVKAGRHHEADGTTYTKGQVVDTDKDLVKMFPEKFELVDGGNESSTNTGKVVVDGGRSGPTSVPVNQSSTTRSAADHQAWDDETASTPKPGEGETAGESGGSEGHRGLKAPTAVKKKA